MIMAFDLVSAMCINEVQNILASQGKGGFRRRGALIDPGASAQQLEASE